jgi:hypothetical protein
MHEAEDSTDRSQVRFCPFCKEGFTGRQECPEHELLLVGIDDLPKQADRASDSVQFFVDPRLGRGPVGLGALLVLIGFVAPFARSRGLTASALEVAIDGAVNLWFAPGSAMAMLWIAWGRRTRRSMRAARAAIFGLALSGGLPLAYTAHRVRLMSSADGVSVDFLWGLWLMVAGLLISAIGAPRFGGPNRVDSH